MSGRPYKKTPECEQSIIDLLSEGNTRKTSCIASGISEDTFARWIKEDEDFAGSVKKAEEEAVARNVKVIHEASKSTWQAAAWWLERRRPDDFRVRNDVNHSGALKVEVSYIDEGSNQSPEESPGPSEG